MNEPIKKLKSFENSDICLNEVANQEKEMLTIYCFYDSKFNPCSFITDTEPEMEQHYKKVHYPKAKEVYHG